MSHQTEPKVFCIGESMINRDELKAYLESLGVEDWETNSPDDISEIIEIDGRGCYLSFGKDLNDNISRVRKGNKSYIDNIIKVKHGSVLEHGFINFQIVDCSRVFTHELVRHRVGTAISQESLRFVRTNDLGYWIPECFKHGPEFVQDFIVDIFNQHWHDCERRYKAMLSAAAIIEEDPSLDDIINTLGDDNNNWWIDQFNKLPMDIKKKYTSAARRFLPIGMATKIGWSCNIRSLRAIIEQRTHPSSEEEMRLIFGKIGRIAQTRWKNLFNDYRIEIIDGMPWFKTDNLKV